MYNFTSIGESSYDFQNGTSFGTPLVSGIVGLMCSIQKFQNSNHYFGVELDPLSNKPKYCQDVQRKVYDIMTFTANKIHDYDNFSELHYENKIDTQNKIWLLEAGIDPFYFSSKFPDGTPYQYNYVEQTNDNLKRWWAQRVGFGLVNAYRAVAHSIRTKGQYIYTSNDSFIFQPISGSMNKTGQLLLHLGAYVREGANWYNIPISRGPSSSLDAGDLKVLEWGGASLSTDPYQYNNQGVTIIDDDQSPLQRIQLEVGITSGTDYKILAIDGILYSNQPEMDHFIRTIMNGKILIEGYIGNVEVIGNLRVGDLIIDFDQENTGGVGAFWSGNTSEVYGDVRMINNGMFYTAWNGECILRAGSEITMDGNQDIEVYSYGTLRMDSHSKINEGVNATEDRKVHIYNNGYFVVDEDAMVDIDCEVYVENGTFEIMEGAKVTLKNFNIAEDGKLIVHEGATLILTEPRKSKSRGLVSIIGTADNRCKISGEVAGMDEGCCLEECDEVITPVKILFRGNCDSDPVNPDFIFEYTDFDNVYLSIWNCYFPPIRYCDFTVNSSIPRETLTSSIISIRKSTSCPNNNTISINNCSFIDFGQPEGLSIRDYKYHITGVSIYSGSRPIIIDENTFDNLEFGICSWNNPYIEVKKNEFNNTNLGFFDNSSTSFLCNNYFGLCEFGSSYHDINPSKSFDNDFRNIKFGINIFSGEYLFTKSNKTQNFAKGIMSIEGHVVLNPVSTNLGTLLFGLNKIDCPTSPWDNPYLDQFLDNSFERNDIEFTNKDATLPPKDMANFILLINGFNELSINSLYHLKGYSQNYNVSNNKFNYNPPICQIRSSGNLTIDPNTINICSGDYRLDQTANCITEYTTMLSGDDNIDCYDSLSFNIGNWNQYSPDSQELKDIYARTLLLMSDTTIDCKCRKAKARDLLHAASIMDSTKERIENVIPELADLINFGTCPDFDCELLNLKAKAFEQIGEIDSALITYQQVFVLCPGSIDSIHAAWGWLRLYAEKVDPDHGQVYDSLMTELSDIILNDLRNNSDLPPPPPIKYAAGYQQNLQETELYQNTPNPFTEKTDFGFFLAKKTVIKLSISDIFGNHIQTIAEGAFGPGNHEFCLDSKNLVSGLYYYSLEYDGNRLTKSLLIIK